jgi:hypothetical protein
VLVVAVARVLLVPLQAVLLALMVETVQVLQSLVHL